MAEKYNDSFFNEYTVIKKIGEGGNSNVYEVVDSERKKYALKLQKQNLNSSNLKRFKNEINFCIKKDHPNLIKVIGNGIVDKTEKSIFYVMPLYPKTLRELITNKISQENINIYVIQLLNGLEFIHNNGAFHRDLKPENILFDLENNNLVISDLGIAHFEVDDIYTSVETRLQDRLANFQYAAPEQRERGKEVDFRCDIYSLGLIFNEMITGNIAIGEDYIKVSDIYNEYAFFDNIIKKMLSQKPSNRYQSIEEIRVEFLAGLSASEREKSLQKLKAIEILESEEKDILISDPPKLVDYKYIVESGRFSLFLDKEVSEKWVSCMFKGSYNSILGYGPENFNHSSSEFWVNVPVRSMDSLQNIVDYFKGWISNANSIYPKLIKTEREEEYKRKISDKEEEIKRREKADEVLSKLSI